MVPEVHSLPGYRCKCTFIKECKHRSNTEDVSAKEHFSLFCVYDDERKHSVQHLSGFFGTKTGVEMKDSLPIAVRLVVESVFLLHFPAVVYFTVVEQANVRIGE